MASVRCPAGLLEARNAEIVKAHQAGEGVDAIAARYGLARKTVLKVWSINRPPAAIFSDPEYTARAITKAAELAEVTTHALRNRGRSYDVTRARWAVWAGMSRRGVGLSGIGRRFGMDHTTIGYGLTQAARLAANDPGYYAFLQEVNAA